MKIAINDAECTFGIGIRKARDGMAAVQVLIRSAGGLKLTATVTEADARTFGEQLAQAIGDAARHNGRADA